ncbi:MAG: DUF3857 domain-containing protein [Leeuwenhoekiella sp.]
MKFLFSLFLLFQIFFVGYRTHAQDTSLSVFSLKAMLDGDVDSVKRSEETTIDLTEKGSLNYSLRRTMTVFNKRGLGDVGAYVGYSDNVKVKNIEAWVHDASGKEIDHIKNKDFEDVSAVSGVTLYSDDRVLFLDYTPYSYPITIVLEIDYKSRTTAFLPAWEPLSAYSSSCESSTYTVLHNPGEAFHIKEYNLEGLDITTIKEPGKTVWTANNLSPIDLEDLAPPFYDIMPRVRLSLEHFHLEGVAGSGGTWQQFGSWMNQNLIAGTQEIPEETQDEIISLTQNLESAEEKARAVYQFVQDKVRYISVQIGIGGWKPMLAEDVDRLAYGDCKALSNYTKSLMDLIGVTSYYAIIYGGDEVRSLDEDIVGVQGNHAVLALDLNDDDGLTWLECTSQTAPFGHTAGFTDNRNAMLVTPEGGKIVATRKYGAEDNFRKRKVDIALFENGNVTGSLISTSKGLFYDRVNYMETLDEQKLKEFYLSNWNSLNGLSVAQVDIKNDRRAVDFKETVAFAIPNFVTQVNEDMLLKPNLWGYGRGDIPTRYSERKLPFKIEYSKSYEDTVSIKIPVGMYSGDLPEPVSLESEFGTYTASITRTETGMIVYTRRLTLNGGLFPAEKYEDYRDFYKKMARYDSQKILITSKS